MAATKEHKDHALSVIGEFVIGRGISDMYTALGAAGTSNAAIPPPDTGGPPGTYTPNLDPGFAAYDAAGNLELDQMDLVHGGRGVLSAGCGRASRLFANYGHMQSANSERFGGAAVMDPVAGRTRESESLYNVGGFFDPTKATRIGVDGASTTIITSMARTRRTTRSMSSAFLFF